MFQSLANRNDSNSITALRVCERYDDIRKKSEGNIARFAIVLARVLDGDQWTIEDYRGVVKIDAVLGEIERSLLFIPREHDGSVATLCRYVKAGPTERSFRLTFELSGRRRQDARPGLAKMYRVPPDRAWWPAVVAPVERRVGRSRYAEKALAIV